MEERISRECGIRNETETVISSDGSDFSPQDPVFSVIGFLEIELTLQADEQIAGHPETELESQGDPCA